MISRNMTIRNCEIQLMCDNPLILYSTKINIENMKFINYQRPKYKMYKIFYSTKKYELISNTQMLYLINIGLEKCEIRRKILHEFHII